jgi:hypothetical protein
MRFFGFIGEEYTFVLISEKNATFIYVSVVKEFYFY